MVLSNALVSTYTNIDVLICLFIDIFLLDNRKQLGITYSGGIFVYIVSSLHWDSYVLLLTSKSVFTNMLSFMVFLQISIDSKNFKKKN